MQTGTLLASAVNAADIYSLAFNDVKRLFLDLFPRRSESIWKKRGHKRWFTQHSSELSDQQIIAAIEGRLPLFAGARFARQTRFAVIDIDTVSPYYNALSLVRLRRALELAGLGTSHHYQSSDSGGWHVWLFFNALVDADEVNKLLSAWLKKQGFALGSGVLEIFPSANGLRIPLQPGFAWVSDKKARAELTLEQALRRFISDTTSTNEWQAAADFITADLAAGIAQQRSKKRRSGLIPDKWKLGQQLWRSGLQQWGQRHEAILAVEHYLWFGDDEAGIEALPGFQHDDARERLIVEWLEAKHNGMCRHINHGNWKLVVGDIHRACRWRTSANTHTPYAHTERKIERMMEDPSLTPKRFITGNIARYNYALKRITDAFTELSSGGRKPSVNEVAEKAGAHWNTVRKHWDLLTASSNDQSPGNSRDLLLGAPGVKVLRAVASPEKFSSAFSPLCQLVARTHLYCLRRTLSTNAMPISEIHSQSHVESVERAPQMFASKLSPLSHSDNYVIAQQRQALIMPTEFGQCQIVDNRSIGPKLLDFGSAAVHRAIDSENYKRWAADEQQKFLGIGEGLNQAKEDVKKAAVNGATAVVDGRIANAVVHAPETMRAVATATVHATETVAHDPNAGEHAVKALSGMIQKASADYSALASREQGKVIGHAMFAMINPEGSTEAASVAVKAADNIATHVDATVIGGIQKSMQAIEDMVKSSPELAQHAKQMLLDYTHGLRMGPRELEYAGVPKGFFDEIKPLHTPEKPELHHAMSDKGFRGDHDLYSPLNERGRPKSHINADGNMTPSNIDGEYKGRKVWLSEHLNGSWCKAQKALSPYTSWDRDKDHVIAKFGKDWVELDLGALKKEMSEGKVPTVKAIHDTDAIVESIKAHPTFPQSVKDYFISCATKDNEFLVEGVIPQRFLKVRGK